MLTLSSSFLCFLFKKRARVASQDDSKIPPSTTLRSSSPPLAAQPSQSSQLSQPDSGKPPPTIPFHIQAGVPQGQPQSQPAKQLLESIPAYNPLTSNYPLLTDLSGIISNVSQKPRTPSLETTAAFGHFQLFPSGSNGLFPSSTSSSQSPFRSNSVPPRLDPGSTAATQVASYDPLFTRSFSPLSAPNGPSGSAHTLWNQPSLLGSVHEIFGV